MFYLLQQVNSYTEAAEASPGWRNVTSESVFLLERNFNAASERKTTLFLIHRLMRHKKALGGSENVP